MGEQNGNPPIDFDRAVHIVGGAELPVPTAQNCLANASNETPPDQVTAMALVGILHQLEQRTEQETKKFEMLIVAADTLQDAQDAANDELRGRLEVQSLVLDGFLKRMDAMQDVGDALLGKLDTYRERLEDIERSLKATEETDGGFIPLFQVCQDGADFYEEVTGDCVWSAPFKVPDDDLDGAIRARSEFMDWAKGHGMSPVFVGP